MLMPPASKARRMASRLLAIGVRRPFSKSLTVLKDTLAHLASSSCDQSSQPRAARLCAGDSVIMLQGCSRPSPTSTISVDVHGVHGYNGLQRKSLRLYTPW